MLAESNRNYPEKYALVFMTNEAYASSFLVTLASALISSNLEDFNIYVGYAPDDPIDETWETVTQLCQRFKFPVERCRRVEVDLDIFKKYGVFSIGSYHTYGRICLANMIREPVLLYLDSDMIVLDDLAKLVKLAPETTAIAAVQDWWVPTHMDEPYEIVGHEAVKDTSPYFNGGLLLTNRSKYCNSDVFDQLKELSPRIENVTYFDQTYLNIIFKNKWKSLPAHWNVLTHPRLPGSFVFDDRIASIIHFATPEKPWRHAEINIPNILWLSIAQNIGIELEPTVSRNYSELAKQFKLHEYTETRKKYIHEMIDLVPSLEQYREQLFHSSEQFGAELSVVQSWLKHYQLDPISEPFTHLLELIK